MKINIVLEWVLEIVKMYNEKYVNTPFASHFKICMDTCPKTPKDMDDMSEVPYVSVVGSLMDAMMCTSPHISHVMGVVRRYMDHLGKEN